MHGFFLILRDSERYEPRLVDSDMVAEILDVQGKALAIFALAALGKHDSFTFL